MVQMFPSLENVNNVQAIFDRPLARTSLCHDDQLNQKILQHKERTPR